MVDELIVECVYRAEGCSYTAQRQVMPQHLRDACLFAEVTCGAMVSVGDDEDEGERTCGTRTRRKSLSAHLRIVHAESNEATDRPPMKRVISNERRLAESQEGVSTPMHTESSSSDVEDHDEVYALLSATQKLRLTGGFCVPDTLMSARILRMSIHRPTNTLRAPCILPVRVLERLLLFEQREKCRRHVQDRSADRTEPDSAT